VIRQFPVDLASPDLAAAHMLLAALD